MHAMSWGSIVVACVAAIGGVIAWCALPAHAPESDVNETDPEGELVVAAAAGSAS
jgi:hypothetical protein